MGEVAVKQMYHQIFVSSKDRVHFVLFVVNFQLTLLKIIKYAFIHLEKLDSPCIANWVVKKTAKDQTKSYSKRAIESNLEHFYMDDIFDSFSSQTEGINICEEIFKILKKGGFHLTKFVSNDR